MSSSPSRGAYGTFPLEGESPVVEMARLMWAVERSLVADARTASVRLRQIDAVREEWERTFADPSTGRLSELSQRALRAEVAAAMHLTERVAESLLEQTRILIHDLPRIFSALANGDVDQRTACSLADISASISDDLLPEFEERVLVLIDSVDPTALVRRARREREKLMAESLRERHERAAADRRVRLEPTGDGMVYLTMFLPAPEAVAIFDRVDRIGRHLRTESETRTLDQLRIDVITDLLLDEGALVPAEKAGDELRSPASVHRGIRPSVHVTVPVLALLGHSEEPATLEGYGPIDIETARRLAGAANGFTRILTHPETGATLSFGRDRYVVPAELRAYLRTRDETCRFIGCNWSAAHCDIDHTNDWAKNGPTDHDNLAHLCRGHHRLKHGSRWEVAQAAERSGALTWTSPLGRTYETQPATRFAPNLRAHTEWATDPPPF